MAVPMPQIATAGVNDAAPGKYLSVHKSEDGTLWGLTEGGQWEVAPDVNKTTLPPSEIERLGKGADDVVSGVQQAYLYHTDPEAYGKFTHERDQDLDYYNRALREWTGGGVDWYGLGGEAGMLAPVGMANFGRTTVGKTLSATAQGAGAGGLLYTPEGNSRALNTIVGGAGGMATVPAMSVATRAVAGGVRSGINALNKLRSAVIPNSTLTVRLQNAMPEIAGLSAPTRERVLAEARRQLELTGSFDAPALQRIARAEELGFQGDTALTTGQATRNGTLFDRERNLAKHEDGTPLRSRFMAQNRRLSEELRDELPISSTTNAESGEAVIKAVNDRWDETQRGVSNVYKLVENRYGDATIQDGLPGFQRFLVESDVALDVTADPIMDSIRRKVDKMGLTGDEPAEVSVKQIESLRKFIGGLSKGTRDPNIMRVKREAIDALDDAVVDTFGDDVFAAARDKARQRFQQFSSKLLTKIVQGDTSGDRLFQRVMSADTADVKQMKYVLETGGEQGQEAWQALRSKVLDELWEKAAPNGADGNFLPATFRKELKRIGENKLKVLFTPDEYSRLMNIKQTSVDTMVAPPVDTINRSNSAPTLLNMMRRIPTVGGEVAGRVGDAMDASARQFDVERAMTGAPAPQLSLDEVMQNMEALSRGKVGQALTPLRNAAPAAPGLLFQQWQQNQ